MPKKSPQRKATKVNVEPNKSKSFPVVGIGASAGGLEACTRMLSKLPGDTGMAFVLIQHLDPAHESMLTELLSRKTHLPVQEAGDGVKVEPNHVYVIPRDAGMVISDGMLRLTSRREDSGKHMPVDRFLHSLAEDRKSAAIGVILSGTGSDGALGIRSVKAEGGLIFVQDEATAKFPGMPQSATDTGCADFVLPPEKIAQELAALSRHPYVRQAGEPSEKTEPVPQERDVLSRIFQALRTATGVDFAHYKPGTIKRRILRRLAVHGIEHIGEYARYLRGRPEEVRLLYEDLLISVTGFFRDPDVFETLKTKVFPRLLKNRPSNSPIRVWVPGCSSGEEVYSIAICLLEVLADAGKDFDVQVFGTDVSDMAIDRARAGVYPENIREDVSQERLQRFFVRIEKNGYQVSKRVRETCVFAKQNLIKDPPFSRMDLISCRNVLIYLDSTLQEKAQSLLNYALMPGGFLLLGKSESIGLRGPSFVLEDKKQKLYSKRMTAAAPVLEAVPRVVAEIPFAPVRRHVSRGSSTPLTPSLPSLTVARGGLAPPLRSALDQAKTLGERVSRKGLQLEYGDRLRTFDLDVIPITSAQVSERLWMFLLQETSAPQATGHKRKMSAKGKAVTGRLTEREAGLQRDLSASAANLQALVEEYEANNEELLSANEEIQSSNEELQSTNEELQTAKEELQASNEELVTVNEELQNRNAELSQARNDLTNLFSSANLPVVMVGNDLRIRHFTPAPEKVLNLIAADVGRPITDINLGIVVENLEQQVREVIETLHSKEAVLQDRTGRWRLLRIRPYRTTDNKIEGAVLVLVDIDELKQSRELSRDLRAIIEAVRESLVLLDEKDRVKLANQYFYKTFRALPLQTEDRSIYEVVGGRLSASSVRVLLDGVRHHNTRWQNVKVEFDHPDKKKVTMLLNAQRLPDSKMTLLIARDLEEI